jgi:hypothetical protein
MKYERSGSCATDFRGALSFRLSSWGFGVVWDFERQGGVILVHERGRFEAAVFDEAHFLDEKTEEPLTFCGNYGGAACGPGDFEY